MGNQELQSGAMLESNEQSTAVTAGMQGLGSDIGAQIELEAKVSRLDKGLAATKIQVYIPGPVRQLYAEMKVCQCPSTAVPYSATPNCMRPPVTCLPYNVRDAPLGIL